jgi:hypothetical protein
VKRSLLGLALAAVASALASSGGCRQSEPRLASTLSDATYAPGTAPSESQPSATPAPAASHSAAPAQFPAVWEPQQAPELAVGVTVGPFSVVIGEKAQHRLLLASVEGGLLAVREPVYESGNLEFFRVEDGVAREAPELARGLPPFGSIDLAQEPDGVFPEFDPKIGPAKLDPLGRVGIRRGYPGTRTITLLAGRWPDALWLVARREGGEMVHCASDAYRWRRDRWVHAGGTGKFGTCYYTVAPWRNGALLALVTEHRTHKLWFEALGPRAPRPPLLTVQSAWADDCVRGLRSIAFTRVFSTGEILMVGSSCKDGCFAIERWAKHARRPRLTRFPGLRPPTDDAIAVQSPSRIHLRTCGTRPFDVAGPEGFCPDYELELEYTHPSWRVASAALVSPRARQRPEPRVSDPDRSYAAAHLSPFRHEHSSLHVVQVARLGDTIYVVVGRTGTGTHPDPTALLAAEHPEVGASSERDGGARDGG